MRISTAEIKHLIMEFVVDGKVYKVQDFKDYISQKSPKEFTSGQISGGVYQLAQSGQLDNFERGLYRRGNKAQKINPIGFALNADNNSEQAELYKQIKNCLQETESQLENIVSKVNAWELTTKDFQFIGEIKQLNEQMKEIVKRCQ